MKPFNVFPYDSNFDFMRLRWVSLAIAALLLLGAIGAIAFKGFNFALDFTGGVSVELRYDKVPDVDGVRAKLDAAGYEGAQVQRFGGGNDVLVKLQAQPQQAGDQVSSIGDGNAGRIRYRLQTIAGDDAHEVADRDFVLEWSPATASLPTAPVTALKGVGVTRKLLLDVLPDSRFSHEPGVEQRLAWTRAPRGWLPALFACRPGWQMPQIRWRQH